VTEAHRTAEQRWIPVAEQLPMSGFKVLAFWKNELGNGRRACAEWIEARSQSGENFDDNTPDDWFDTDESGTSWIPEGWYETSETAEERRYIDIPVSHWMPLPEMPT
jgi:hypothetical protein